MKGGEERDVEGEGEVFGRWEGKLTDEMRSERILEAGVEGAKARARGGTVSEGEGGEFLSGRGRDWAGRGRN